MTFTVTYKPSAERELAEAWLNAADRQAVTTAANRVDRLLQSDPHGQGEARERSIRILVERPLAVLFEIHDEDCRVEVIRVRYVGG